ncbi:MAG TPA: hypothetical protein VKX17_17610 [Planctomycetota bacterium]|nr:hypothetical protein [Planctomycetota bacterium]
MDDLLAAYPMMKPLIGIAALIAVLLLAKVMFKNFFSALKFILALGVVLAGVVFYLDSTGYFGRARSEGADFSEPLEEQQTTPRQLFAQIVDTEEKDAFSERAILEGRPYKYLLHLVSKKTNAELRKANNDRTTFENLLDEGDLHRGEAYAAGRGVIVEATEVELPPEYGFPKGWTVIPAVFINTAREVYALRVLCPPGSGLYKKIKKSLDDDQEPVMNLAGLFMKCYARKTGDPKEPPWVRPLLICTEPEFLEKDEPRKVLKEIEEAGYAHLLPSQRIDAPGADERLVIDVALEKDAAKIHAWGQTAGASADVNTFVAQAVDRLKKRLPAEHVAKPSAVLMVKGGMPDDARVTKIVEALKAAGVTRVCVKQEFENTVVPGK